MSGLVLVVPLREGVREEARRLLADGPPFDLGETVFDAHRVYLTEREAVFVFESPTDAATLTLRGEDLPLLRAAAAWRPLLDGSPRKAEVAYAWTRPAASG